MRWKLHGIELSPFYTTAWPGERSVKMLRQDILQWQQTVLARQADQPILLTFRVRSTYSEWETISRYVYTMIPGNMYFVPGMKLPGYLVPGMYMSPNRKTIIQKTLIDGKKCRRTLLAMEIKEAAYRSRGRVRCCYMTLGVRCKLPLVSSTATTKTGPFVGVFLLKIM